MEKPGKPTIHELEKILSEPGGVVEVLPDGSVVVNEELTILRARVVQLEAQVEHFEGERRSPTLSSIQVGGLTVRVAELELAMRNAIAELEYDSYASRRGAKELLISHVGTEGE